MALVIRFCVIAKLLCVGKSSKLRGNLCKAFGIFDIAAETAFGIIDYSFGFT